MMMLFAHGITIAIPRPFADGMNGLSFFGANFSTIASTMPRIRPTSIATWIDGDSESRPLANARDTPSHTRHDGAGHSESPSTDGSGMMMLNAGTMKNAPATTPNSCAY